MVYLRYLNGRCLWKITYVALKAPLYRWCLCMLALNARLIVWKKLAFLTSLLSSTTDNSMSFNVHIFSDHRFISGLGHCFTTWQFTVHRCFHVISVQECLSEMYRKLSVSSVNCESERHLKCMKIVIVRWQWQSS